MDPAPEELVESAKQIVEKLEDLRKEVARPADEGYRSGAKLLDKIRGLAGSMSGATAPPTDAQREWLETFDNDLNDVMRRFDVVAEQDIPAFGQKMDAAGIPRVFR
jgi:hypothetical protein